MSDNADANHLQLMATLERIAVALEKQVPAFVFVPDNGGLVSLPEHLRETAQSIQPTPITGAMTRLAQSLDTLAARKDPAVKAIAAEMADLVNLLRLGAASGADVEQALTDRAAVATDESRPAPSLQRQAVIAGGPIPAAEAVPFPD